MDTRYKSDIPSDAEETLLMEYKQEGCCIWLKKTACWHHGKIVGERSYEQDGTLLIETPLKNGKKHGWNIIGRRMGGCRVLNRMKMAFFMGQRFNGIVMDISSGHIHFIEEPGMIYGGAQMNKVRVSFLKFTV